MMQIVGYMPMPADFRYKAIYDRGKPSLPKKHPMMDTGHRAKIFAPFDALRGFNFAIMSKEVPYMPKCILEEEEQAELNSAPAWQGKASSARTMPVLSFGGRFSLPLVHYNCAAASVAAFSFGKI